MKRCVKCGEWSNAAVHCGVRRVGSGLEELRESGKSEPLFPIAQNLRPLPRDWGEELVTWMLTLGTILLACFFAPWAIGEDAVSFAWTAPKTVAAGFTSSLLFLTGVAFLLGGAGRIPTLSRSGLAAGGGSFAYFFSTSAVSGAWWHGLLWNGGVFLLLTGLVLHVRTMEMATTSPWGSVIAQRFASVGAILVMVLHVVPSDGLMPVQATFNALSAGSGGWLVAITGVSVKGVVVGLLPLVIVSFGFLVWLPLGVRWTLRIIVALLVVTVVSPILSFALIGEHRVDAVNLFEILYFPVARSSWLFLAALGAAELVIGRSAQRRTAYGKKT